MVEPFSDIERRVLGTLVEKQLTVPDTYPLTLNALVAGCNQKTSRDPETDHEPSEVQRSLDDLKARGVVRFVHPSHGARSTKFRHVLDDHLGLEAGELALVSVLLLRGAQTLSELRSRTERAHGFADLDEVEAAMRALATRADPLVARLEHQPGQREARWVHLLGDVQHPPADVEPDVHAAAAPLPVRDEPMLLDRVDDLERRLAAVESVLEELGVSPSPGND